MLDSHPHPALAFGGSNVMNESPREHWKYRSHRHNLLTVLTIQPHHDQRGGVFCFPIRSMILKDLQPRLERN